MNFFKKYPLCAMVSANVFVLIAFQNQSLITKSIALGCIVLIFLLFTVLYKKGSFGIQRTDFKIGCGIFLFLILGLFQLTLFCDFHEKPIRANIGQSKEITAKVCDIIYETSFHSCYGIDIKKSEEQSFRTKALLECDFRPDIRLGEIIVLKANLEDFEEESFGFNSKSYYHSQGYLLRVIPESDKDLTVISREYTLSTMLHSVSGWISQRFSDFFSANTAALADAFLLGDRSQLTPDIERDFRYIGGYHLLAISGMHLNIIIGSMSFLLTHIGIGKKLVCAILIPITFLYMGLAGFSLSVVRAGIMLIIIFLAFLFGREPDSVTALFISVFLICLFSPFAVFDVGLQLSFLSCLGILSLGNGLCRKIQKNRDSHIELSVWRRIVYWISESLTISFSAIIFTVPIMWLSFGEMSVLSPISTLLLSLPLTVFIYAALLSIPFSFIPGIAMLLHFIAEKTAQAILWISRVLSKIPSAMFSLQYEFVKYLFLLFIILVLLFLIFRKRSLLYAMTTSFICCTVLYFVFFGMKYIFFTQSHVSYFNIQSNEALLITTRKETVLCDISSGAYEVCRAGIHYAKTDGYTNIDAYLLTHYHRLHIKTIHRLASAVYLKKLYLPSALNEKESEIYETIVLYARKRGIEVIEYDYTQNSDIEIDGIQLKIWKQEYLKRSTHPLICLTWEQNAKKYAYIGSSVTEGNRDIDLQKAAEISEGIILGVHGPKAKLSPIEFCLVHQTKTIIPEWKITSQFAYIPQMFQQIQDIPHVQIQKNRLRHVF